MDLSGLALAGELSPRLGQLSMLTTLDLADNMLSGDIPASLGSLSMLTELDLSLNALSGPIPAQLGSLGSLRVLDLAGNALSGPIPAQIGSLTSLTTLHIGGGALTGPIPVSLGGLSALESLYLSAPGISGLLPAELGALTNLQTLWIKSGSLTGPVPARYSSLTSLRTLYLSGGALTGPIPAWVASLASLQRLYLHDNSLTGPIPAQLAAMAALSTLWLAGNDLKGPIPAALGTQTALSTLDLRHNPLTWPAPAALAEPRDTLTVLLPDTDRWLPPAPTQPTAEPRDGNLQIAWEHPGAGTGYQVDTYTINHRPATATSGDFTQQAANTSPAVIEGLTSGRDYHIFITATNPQGTSAPSATVTATALASAQSHAPNYYTDLDGDNAWLEPDVDKLALHGIFDGTDCGNRLFCPARALLRWELAVWLIRALDGEEPTATTSRFTDVSTGAWWNPHVKRLNDEGITAGCSLSPPRFCPHSAVTRAQMAVFLVAAFNIAPTSASVFSDVPRNSFAHDQINAIAQAGITAGCSQSPTRRFCPNSNVSRGQMAIFINRACTRYPSRCSYDSGSSSSGPPAPTITNITPGPGTLTIEWAPDTSAPPGTRPVATHWRINYNNFHYAGSPGGRRRINDPPEIPLTRPAASVDPAVGVTLTGLDFDSHYAITVQGLANTTAGTPSTEVTAKTDPAAVRLVALEITQGLQNWQGDIALVKGKRTVVRAFLEPRSGTEAQVDVRLQAVVNGRVVATAAPRNPDVQMVPRIDYNKYLFTAHDGAAADRALLGASANFLLDLDEPGTSDEWVGSPSGQPNLSLPGALHSVTYRLAVADGVICAAAAAQPDSTAAPGTACQTDLEFKFVKTPEVRLVGITAAGMQPTRGDLDEQAQRILSMMPIPDLDYDLRQLNHTYPATPPLGPVLTRLLLTRATDASNRVYLGVLLDNGGGLAIIPGNVAAWYTSGTEGKEAFGYARNRGAHEFGHVIGERHALHADHTTVCGVGNPEEPGPVYPFIEKIGAEYRALLGPSSGGDDERVWGFDTRFVKPHSADPAYIDRLAVINPAEVFALMSYCDHPGDTSKTIPEDTTQERWVDRLYHGLFINSVNGINWDLGPRSGPEGTVDPLESTHSLFSGHTTVAADGSSSEAVLLPVLEVSAALSAPEPPVGGYVLELLDSAGAVLHAVRFDAQVVAADAPGGGSGDVFEVWAVSVPGAPDFESVRVQRSSPSAQMVTVAQAARSASAPTVSITGPTAGQVLSGETVQFSWTGADPDGDKLVYLVQYSTDGGATYETLATDHRAMSLGVPRETLAGSSTARVRVVASDGLRTATAVSARFAVAVNAPQVRIDSPAEAARFGGRQPLALQASAYDSEDGVLASSAISWSSDIDGPLGTGAQLVIDSGGLTAGTHTFTATATDSSNTAASASVTVTVDSHNQPPTATDDTAHVRPGASLIIDVAANDTDPEGDINHATLAVAVPPTAGRAGTRHGRVAYTAAIHGYDVFVYRICDRANQCATAEVTVIALSDQ